MASKEERAASFDRIPELYDENRPGYPEVLYDDLVRLTGLTPERPILEVGCGPGKFTEPLARRGFQVDAVEHGAALVEYATRKLASWPKVRIFQGSFGTWEAPRRYHAVAVASAFHWLDEATRFQHCADLLEPGGFVAICWNNHGRAEYPEIQDVYGEVAPELDPRRNPQVKDWSRTDPSPQFAPVARLVYPFTLTYSPEAYIRLLGTYSNHITLPDAIRSELFSRLTELIHKRFGGRLELPYEAILDLRTKRR